jgi:hypothetical protein
LRSKNFSLLMQVEPRCLALDIYSLHRTVSLRVDWTNFQNNYNGTPFCKRRCCLSAMIVISILCLYFWFRSALNQMVTICNIKTFEGMWMCVCVCVCVCVCDTCVCVCCSQNISNHPTRKNHLMLPFMHKESCMKYWANWPATFIHLLCSMLCDRCSFIA